MQIYGPNGMDDARRHGRVQRAPERRRRCPYEAVEAEARRAASRYAGGCFCNPGAAERAFGFSPAAARACLRGGFSLTSFRACMGDRPVGALRASIGVPTTVADVDRLIEFVESLA